MQRDRKGATMGPLLIVEPHVDTAELVVELLRSVGFESRTYADADAIDGALDDPRPGLLLVSLGPRDQRAIGDLIVEANARAIPVVVMSTADREWPGADAVLTKPFAIEVLVQTVRSLCCPPSSSNEPRL